MSRKPIPRPNNCIRCNVPVTAKNKTGCCRRCKNLVLNERPEFVEARAKAIRDKWANDPEYAAKMRGVFSAIGRANGTDPERRARLAELGKERIIALHAPETRAKVRAKQHIIAQKISERAFAWCPHEYRDQYRYLTGVKNIRAPEARKLVQEQIRKDRERELAKLSPFERQMRALQNGGKLIEVAPKPSLDRPGVFGA